MWSQNTTEDSLKTNINLNNSYYVEANSYGTKRETDPPAYVEELKKIGIKSFEDINWLEVGLDYRSRYEHRQNDIRRSKLTTDNPILLRTRAYFGVKEIIDPFRFVIEFEDAHRVNGKFKPDNRDFNRAELIQLYGELHFKKALGTDNLDNSRPLIIRYGRQAFEFLDRRLIGLNSWRNTTNNFSGFRVQLGKDKNDWQVDILALRPIIRDIDKFDKTDKNRDFWAVIGHWRKWSNVITIEPFYLGLKQTIINENTENIRLIHSPGIRWYGRFKNKKINYDCSFTKQFGNDSNLNHEAFAVTTEIGYLFEKMQSKPRISMFFGYVSGDKNPNDKINNRFERFFGFARPWSADDYIIPENIITPKVKIEFEPLKGVKFDGGYCFYWLASKKDRLNNLLNGSNNRDSSGNSGSFIGHGFDFRIQSKVIDFLEATLGFSHFRNGDFVQNRQKNALGKNSTNSNFLYLELTLNTLKIFN